VESREAEYRKAGQGMTKRGMGALQAKAMPNSLQGHSEKYFVNSLEISRKCNTIVAQNISFSNH